MSWNFALILFVLLVVTGIVWTLDITVLRRKRAVSGRTAADAVDVSYVADPQEATRMRQSALESASRVPWWIEYSVSFFPVILFVFVLRSFVVEPFRIPSGSMLPTLQSGDLILVNKFSYGVRLPVIDKKIVETGAPQRGDVAVFRYPVDTRVDYIKRIVGLPGDEVAYLDKKLYINGELVPHVRDGEYFEPDRVSYITQYNEKLGKVDHQILLDQDKPQAFGPIWQFPYLNNCQYSRNGVRCKVPEGQYFALGDNRDNSADSRYWGFIPDENLVGKAFFIWMNFSDLGRIGSFK